jgi:uncharacterized membrane protein YhaH (DUF805 family)
MKASQFLFSFEGRIHRAPYWCFVLAVTVVFAILAVLAGVSMFSMANPDASGAAPSAGIAGILLPLLGLAVLWPGLAISAKRWHDVDKSAWWILIGFVPVVGGLIALVFNGFIAGTPAANRFGNPPN